MSDARKWLPVSWMDECIPRTEPSPDAFIFEEAGKFYLRCPVGSPDHDETVVYYEPLEEGQIVPFMWRDDCGWHTVTVAECGSWTCSTAWRGDANCFCLDGDIDTLAESMDDLVKGSHGLWAPKPLSPGEHRVWVYYWSDSINFQFDAQSRAFRQVAGAH